MECLHCFSGLFRRRTYALTLLLFLVSTYLYLSLDGGSAFIHPKRVPGLPEADRQRFASHAINNTVVIVPVNSGMLHWVDNLLCSLTPSDFNTSDIIFWALDAKARDILDGQGRATYYDPNLYSVSTNENINGNTDAYVRMMRERPKFYADVLSSGFDMLMLDIDIVFFGQSPLSILPDLPSTDIVYSTDSREFYQTHDAFLDPARRGPYVPPVCNGIFWMRSSPQTISLWTEMSAIWESFWYKTPFGRRGCQDDQRAMDVLLNDGRAQLVQPFPDGIEAAQVLKAKVKPALKVQLLDQTKVVSGHLLLNRNKSYVKNLDTLATFGQRRIAAHFNWSTVDLSKEEGARQLGMMFVDDNGMCLASDVQR